MGKGARWIVLSLIWFYFFLLEVTCPGDRLYYIKGFCGESVSNQLLVFPLVIKRMLEVPPKDFLFVDQIRMKNPRPHKVSPLMLSSTRRRCEFPSEVLSNRRATRRPRGVGLQYGRPIRVQCERWPNQMKMNQSLTFTLNRTESTN